MLKRIKPEAEEYITRNHWKSIWRRIVSALACVVVFCTVYALILPAITLENTESSRNSSGIEMIDISNENISTNQTDNNIMLMDFEITDVEGKEIKKGNLTETVTWRLTQDDNGDLTLIIGGTGEMPEYQNSTYKQRPWHDYDSKIKRIVIEDGVTSI